MELDTGLDGSGDHQTANQASRNEYTQKSRISVIAVVKRIKTKTGRVIYTNERHSSPFGKRNSKHSHKSFALERSY